MRKPAQVAMKEVVVPDFEYMRNYILGVELDIVFELEDFLSGRGLDANNWATDRAKQSRIARDFEHNDVRQQRYKLVAYQ